MRLTSCIRKLFTFVCVRVLTTCVAVHTYQMYVCSFFVANPTLSPRRQQIPRQTCSGSQERGKYLGGGDGSSRWARGVIWLPQCWKSHLMLGRVRFTHAVTSVLRKISQRRCGFYIPMNDPESDRLGKGGYWGQTPSSKSASLQHSTIHQTPISSYPTTRPQLSR